MVTHDACWRRSSNDARSVFIVCRWLQAREAEAGRPLGGATLLHCGKRGVRCLVRARGHLRSRS